MDRSGNNLTHECGAGRSSFTVINAGSASSGSPPSSAEGSRVSSGMIRRAPAPGRISSGGISTSGAGPVPLGSQPLCGNNASPFASELLLPFSTPAPTLLFDMLSPLIVQRRLFSPHRPGYRAAVSHPVSDTDPLQRAGGGLRLPQAPRGGARHRRRSFVEPRRLRL